MTARATIQTDMSVKAVIDTVASADGTYYLIETVHESFPRFVVGELLADGRVRHLLKCGELYSAAEYWAQLTGRPVP